MKVQHDVQNSRFVVPLTDAEAELVYSLRDGTIDLQHTEVPPADRNQGIADSLVRAAIAYARERELRVIPSCPYVKAWLKKHPSK